MRDQIIKYLQGIQCEWFPVERDSFIYNLLGIRYGLKEDQIGEIQIKYIFFDSHYTINYKDNVDDGPVIPDNYHYFSLDRCKTLLLNTVRSVDEPKRKAAGETIKKYEIEIDESDIRVFLAYNEYRGRMVWKNGEFK